MAEATHPELRELLGRLRCIYDAVSNYHPPTNAPPILDSSLEADTDESHWSQRDHIPGLKKLKESLKLDLDGLEKFLDDPSSAHRPPLSTNAPYLISVWNELLCASGPVLSVFKMFLFEPKSDVSSSAHRRKTGVRPPGAKVDIVADGGRVWIRINTMKNSRLLAEFREIDSYLTDSGSDSDWDDTHRPTLAQSEFDNSILKMGRTLLQAAHSNPIEGTTDAPHIVMRLTRLDPSPTSGPDTDPRIATTVQMLRDMGIEVQLGERTDAELAQAPSASGTGESEYERLIPSRRINLDLSVLIALISDLTHAPLPASVEEANKRFIPPKEYREWKQSRKRQQPKKHSTVDDSDGTKVQAPEEELSIEDLPHDLATHSRALTNQLLGEMSRSMIQEILFHISSRNSPLPSPNTPTSHAPPPPGEAKASTEFWVTTEARDRCLRIVAKIGAVNEKRRAFALFHLDPSNPALSIPQAQAEALFWQNSRFPQGTLPLFPLHFHRSGGRDDGGLGEELLTEQPNRHPFFKALAGTCQSILEQETQPHPNARAGDHFQFISQRTPFPAASLESTGPSIPPPATETSTISPPTSTNPPPIPLAALTNPTSELQRATVTKANPRLTAHTVESMRWGAELGWTTLTANRTSVRAVLKEVRARYGGHFADWDSSEKKKDRRAGEVLGGEEGGVEGRREGRDQVAALWIVDPRSLAEQMSSSSSQTGALGPVNGVEGDRSKAS